MSVSVRKFQSIRMLGNVVRHYSRDAYRPKLEITHLPHDVHCILVVRQVETVKIFAQSASCSSTAVAAGMKEVVCELLTALPNTILCNGDVRLEGLRVRHETCSWPRMSNKVNRNRTQHRHVSERVPIDESTKRPAHFLLTTNVVHKYSSMRTDCSRHSGFP